MAYINRDAVHYVSGIFSQMLFPLSHQCFCGSFSGDQCLVTSVEVINVQKM